MEKHQTYFDLLTALKEKTCPICSLIKGSIHNFMDSLLYESVNDGEIRAKIRKSLGFCNFHAWQMQKLGDGFGLSIIYEDLLGIAGGILKTNTTSKKNLLADLLSKNPKSNPACYVCAERDNCESRYISAFIEYFNDGDFRSAFDSSHGLCLPHLIKALNICKNKQISKTLIIIESQKIQQLQNELKEFNRKHDYRFSKEGFGEEGNSWIRAIGKMAGEEEI